MESIDIKIIVCDSVKKALKDKKVNDEAIKLFEENFWKVTKDYVFSSKEVKEKKLQKIEESAYYEDYRLKIIESDGKYTIYDEKYGGRAIHKNKTKEWTDDFIQRVLSKRKCKE